MDVCVCVKMWCVCVCETERKREGDYTSNLNDSVYSGKWRKTLRELVHFLQAPARTRWTGGCYRYTDSQAKTRHEKPTVSIVASVRLCTDHPANWERLQAISLFFFLKWLLV